MAEQPSETPGSDPKSDRGTTAGFSLWRLLRGRITTGIFTILPILVTLWVVRLIFVWMRDSSQWIVRKWLLSYVESNSREPPPFFRRISFDWETWQAWERARMPDRYDYFLDLMPWYWRLSVEVTCVLLTIFVLYLIGLFAANLFGRRIIEAIERLVDRLPLIKTIYRLPKQVISTFQAQQAQSFRKAALIPFPQEKMRCVGFITNTFVDSITGEELCTVFIPTTPNPTTGYLQVLKRRDLTELNWTIEDSIRMIMSGGILKPDFVTLVPNKNLPDDVPEGVGASALPPPEAPPPPPGPLSAPGA
ncbi:MAG: DUF502 domain-containing protein [Phycisphaerales bacterium]|nr:DUF502 domain-containing protein [Phycisphaerales bacterium]